MSVMDIYVIGAGATGIVAYRTILLGLTAKIKEEPSFSIKLLEGEVQLGNGTPFRSFPLNGIERSVGAQVISFNRSDFRVDKYISLLSEKKSMIKLLDDGSLTRNVLSSTQQRAQGWNRSSGQWEHYILNENITTVLETMIHDVSTEFELKLNHLVSQLSLFTDNSGNKRWRINCKNKSFECDKAILALPIDIVVDLVQNIPEQEVVSPTIFNVLNKCKENSIKRVAVSFLFGISSEIFKMVFDKFVHEKGFIDPLWEILELNISIPGFFVTSITIKKPKLSIEDIMFIIYGIKQETNEEPLIIEEIENFLSNWLSKSKETIQFELNLFKDTVIFDKFLQTDVNNFNPLIPLRETGFLVVSENPLLIATGDWAVGQGCFSGAVSAGERAAEYLIKNYIGS